MAYSKRIISLLLSLLLVVSVFPAGALTIGAQATAEESFYSFDLLTQFPDGPFTSATNGVVEQKDEIRAYFDAGKIGWAFEGCQNGTKKANGTGETVNSFAKNYFNKGKGVVVQCSGYNWWYAIRIKAPGTGTYDLTINSNTTLSSGVLKHSVWTEAYFFEAAKVTGSTGINDLLTIRNRYENFAPTSEDPDVFIGNVSMKAGKDYILVLRQTSDSYSSANKDTRTQNLYLKGITLVAAAPPPVDTSKVTFDFDLADKKTAIYPDNTYIEKEIDSVHSLYKDGIINWEFPVACGKDARFRTTGGLSSYGKADDYLAMRIKFPGEGTYTLSLNHGQGGRGAVGAVYILPGDTKDIPFAMDTHNRVGKVAFYNENGSVSVTDGITTMLGTWEFEADEEYIVVVEALEKSPYYEQAYLYVSQLVCEKGDKTGSAAGARIPQSVVVDPAPVHELEVCTYIATTEVNGDDYLFLPLEGKKMAVYNIDKGTLVDYADTPFTQVKGITVDTNGILWVVGDNPSIYRYDPVLNVGKQVYYYKNMTGAENPHYITAASVGFGLVYGDDGCIYFGEYPNGHLGKYNTVTGEFTDMGPIGTGDANSYGASPVYDNGFIYVTATGDKDGDGVKTIELAKFDATTGERVMVKDITEYHSQQEVMIRGMGICGGVLIMGGERNDVKQVAAFDAETLEWVDLGIRSAAIYGPTGELDGKVWFGTSTAGVWEFDGTTGKATQVKGLESILTSFRCGVNSFITVEGDNLMPGKSVLTWRGGESDPIGVYNMTTGHYKRIGDAFLLKEYGSTSDVRPIVKVPGEENLLYMGAFNTSTCAVYDIEAGKIIQNFKTEGQTDAIMVYEGKLYTGNYNSGTLAQINTEDDNRNVRLLGLKNLYKQSRVHVITAGDGKVFIGSFPDRYELGGCLAWIDINNLEDQHVERNVIKDQSVISLAYHDGYVFGGGSINGGSGSTPVPGTSAKFFIYDVANKKKVAEYDLHDYFKGLPDTIEAIDGMMADENGKIWMVAAGCLFTFTFDAKNKTIDINMEFSTPTDTNINDVPTAMIVDGDYLYANIGTVGGIQKINMKDTSDHQRMPVPATDSFALGSDGNLYYTYGPTLYMYPLVIADSDWTAAEAVDAQIKALGKTTLDSEKAIVQTRAAYEAMSWTQKALAKNLDLLVAAEIDLLECKINSIGEVTAEDEVLIRAIKAEYQDLSGKNKTYVKNYYTVFVPAMQALQGIIDEKEAARVQALIDTIPGMGEITLEKEEAIRKIEAEYNDLTKQQKELLTNAKPLLDALATIRKLRDERIEYLKQLIAGIGEVTLEDEAAIAEAKEIFNTLTNVERERVDFKTLNAAEAALKKLQQTKAAEVDALILAIGDTIDHSSKDAIEKARKAYDALTPGAQKLVKNLGILIEAEAIFAELGMNPKTIILIVAIAGGALLAAAAVVVVLVVVKKKKAVAAQQPAEETEASAEAVSEETEA